MSKDQVVSNKPDAGPYADNSAFEEVAAIWDAKFQEAKTADEADAAQAEQAETQEAPAPAAAEGGEVVPEAAPAAQDSVEDLLARARQEAETRTRVKQERNFEQEIANARAEAEGLKARLKQSPTEALKVIKELGLNPLDYANYAYAEALGDDAPKEFKDKLNQTALERKVEEQLQQIRREREEWQQAQQTSASQALVTQLDNELVGLVHNVPDTAPFLKKAAVQDKHFAYEALVEATKQLHEALGGQLPTSQQALQVAEAGMERLRRFFQDENSSDAKTLATGGEMDRKPSNSKTLSDTDTAEKPSRRTQDPDPRDTDAWIRRGIRTIKK
jgi:hypothetical protein